VVENLLPSLVPSPPDVETLRVYLTLPFYHEFDNPKNYSVLHNPFGRTFLSLKTEAGKIVGECFISYTNTFSLASFGLVLRCMFCCLLSNWL
jgi:E3 ubiquitin-protein ligase HERC4